MNIAALLGTSGVLPDQLGKVVTAGVNSPEFKQLFQNMVWGEVTPELSTPTLVAAAGTPAMLQADLLSTLYKLFTTDLGQVPTLDPTGEASDAEQDENKASLTELMTALQPLVGQSDVTLATGQATLPAQLPEQLTTAQLQNLITTNAAEPAGVYTTPSPIITNHSQSAQLSNTTPLAHNQTATLATTDAAIPATASTTPPTSTPHPALSPTTNTSLPMPAASAASTSTTAAPPPAATAALSAAGTPAEGAINLLNKPNQPPPTTDPFFSTAPAVNGAPARASTITFAQALSDAAAAPPATPDSNSQPATPASVETAALPASHIAPNGSQPPEITVASPQNRPEQLPLEAATGPAAPPLEVASSVTTAKPTAAPEMPKLPALEQITESVKLLVQQGETEVRMQLYPKSLGQVHIQLHLTQEGNLTVRMLTETVQAQNLIQEHLPQLKAAFSAQGMQLNQLNVDVGSDSSAFYNQARHSGNNSFAGSQHTPNNRSFANDSTPTPMAAQNQVRLGSLNAIDYHA